MVECPATCLPCAQSPQTRIWCHLSCEHILNSSYPDGARPSRDDLLSFGTRTQPMWEELQATTHDNDVFLDRKILIEYTSQALRGRFPDGLVKRLPDDIISLIMDKIGPGCISAIRETYLLINRMRRETPGTNTFLSISGVIYGSTLFFRGHSYISKISDQRNRRDEFSKLRGRLRTGGCRVAISFDEIGVRNIRTFDPEVSIIPVDGSPWYHVKDVDFSSKMVFECTTDVSSQIIACKSSDIASGPHYSKYTPWTNLSTQRSIHLGHSQSTCYQGIEFLLSIFRRHCSFPFQVRVSGRETFRVHRTLSGREDPGHLCA